LSLRELQSCSDEQLVELVLDGQDAAFELLFDRHVADAVWFAREVLGTWWEAEEAVRHSFAAAHAYLAARGREVEFRPWLHTIVGNHCLSMLQARTPGRGERANTAAVVDLEQWRRRRKRLGALPIAPSAGFHDSVMTACGIGAGATTAAAPLLGATVAKLAVVAVLAGSAGVAGNVVSNAPQRDDAGGARASIERSAEAVWVAPVGVAPPREPWGDGRGRSGSRLRERAGNRPPARGWLARRAERHTGSAPLGDLRPDRSGAPDGSAGAPGGFRRSPAEPPRSNAGSLSVADGGPISAPRAQGLARSAFPAVASAARPVRAALRGVGAAVEAHVPALAPRPSAGLPDPVGLAKIGDDLGVAPVEPPVDVRALLSRATGAQQPK
jgi:hypothetical protein